MAHDEISFIVRQDQMIITLGKRIFANSGRDAHEHQYVRQKMSELGRLLLQVRKLDRSVHTLQECIDPTQFQLVVEAVRVVSGYEESGNKYKTPSLALKLGHSLKKCAQYTKSQTLQADDGFLTDKADNFHQLCSIDSSGEVPGQALSMAEDIRKLHLHLGSYFKAMCILFTSCMIARNSCFETARTC